MPATATVRAKETVNSRQTVLVLQGGGALGAYQGGVYQQLAEHDITPDWVVGTSIGAINGAIIAGNPPAKRLARLQEFWQLVSRDDAPSSWNDNPFTAWLQPWLNMGAAFDVVSRGIPGFFVPRTAGIPNLTQNVATASASFYDTSPLHATLERLIDFNYLNEGHVRCTVCAVQVDNGLLTFFDNKHKQGDRRKKDTLTARHIMASGALPPGFAPVVIDGKAYWDGGVYSNTPVDVVMDDAERRDTLCFMVDLWDATQAEPRSINAAMARQKHIQYASRTSEHLQDHRTMQDMRRAIQLLAQRLPAKDRAAPQVRRLTELGCASTINVVRLVLKSGANEDYMEDIDFSRNRLTARWQAGQKDAARALRHKSWLAPVESHVGMVIHELEQEGKSARRR